MIVHACIGYIQLRMKIIKNRCTVSLAYNFDNIVTMFIFLPTPSLYVLDKIGKTFLLCLMGWLLLKMFLVTKCLLQFVVESNWRMPLTSNTRVFLKT